MSWLRAKLRPETAFADAFGLRRDLYEAYESFLGLFWKRRLVDPLLLELCRMRIAYIHGCSAELARREPAALDAGLSELHVAALTDESRLLSLGAVERACLRLADKFALDVHAISDEDVTAVRDALGEAATVALIEALALFDGFSRFRVLLGIDDGRAAGIGEANG